MNVVTANATAVRGDPPAEVEATATVIAEDAAAKLSITKTADPTKGVVAGDMITYKVVVKNEGNVSVKDGVLADDHVNLSGETFVLAPGEETTFTYTYEAIQEDIDAGQIVNVVTANATAVRGNDPEEVKADATVTVKVIVKIKEHSGTEKYDGTLKTVTGYDVEISNPTYKESDFEFSGNATVAQTDAGTYQMELKAADFTNINDNYVVEFVIVDGQLNIEKRNVTLTSATDTKVYDGTALTNSTVTVGGDGFATGDGTTYNVTGSQTETGSSTNTFTYTLNEGTKADNYTLTKTEGILTVTPVTDLVTVTITENSGSDKYDGTEKAVEGYTVTEIDNDLYTVDDFTFSGDATVTGTDAGTYDMELTDSDFANTNANFVNVKFVIVDGKLEITKRTVTMTSATDKKVYDGTALTNSNVTESGDGFVNGDGATYNVTGSQTLVGSSGNTFTYTLKSGTKADNYAITKVEGTLTVTDGTGDDEEPVPDDLVVTKTADDTVYKLGETATFAITATNIYDEARTIELSEIDGVTLAQSVFEAVAPGATIETTVTHVVTENDILAGKFVNTVTATVGNITKTATAEIVTEPKNPHMTVTKITTSETPEEGYALGEEITYEITVTNDGNLTISNIVVTDELTGDEWTIDSLAPGESSKVFEASYTVTEEDVLAGEVLNVATAKGTSSDPEDPDVPVDPGEDPEPTEKKNGHLALEKISTSTPEDGNAYKAGETIQYLITVINDGNLTITDIMVTDELTGDEWAVDSLAPGASEEFETTYVVTEEDAVAGSVLNIATAKGTSPDPENPDVPVEPAEDPEPTQDEFTLTVNYWMDGEIINTITRTMDSGTPYNIATPPIEGYSVNIERVTGNLTQDTTVDVVYTINTYTLTILYLYRNGDEAAPTYTQRLNYNAEYSVASPRINGFRADRQTVAGTMPARNVTITVFYTTVGQVITIDDFETPLGLGIVGINAGETIE